MISFILGPVPTSLYVTNLTTTSAKLNWDAVPGVIGYKVRYKVAGTSEWTSVQSYNNDKTLRNLTPNTEYAWQVKSICEVRPIISSAWSEKLFFTTNSLKLTAIEAPIAIKISIYPNPFLSSAIISFSLQQDSYVAIELLDVAGKKLQTLLDEYAAAGDHHVPLERNREHLKAGIYLLHFKSYSGITTQKIVIQ